MKKISVITLHTVINYGSILQTYATSQILTTLGYQVEFVNYWRKNNTREYIVAYQLKALSQKKYVNKLTKPFLKVILNKLFSLRREKLDLFLKENINLTTKVYTSIKELKEDVPTADIYLTGSDQVWNSSYNQGIELPFFLDYAPKDKARIAFAASIGKTEFSNAEVDKTCELLRAYDYITLREASGIELLKKYNIKANLILDPTLMLTKEDWEELAILPQESKPYLLVYQLSDHAEFDAYVEKLAQKENLKIIRISYKLREKFKKGKWRFMPSVERFLGYLIKADCIITDSFHITSFALNLSKKFIAILPEKYSTRITNITALTHTENRVLDSFSNFDIYNSKMDFEEIQAILQQQRALSKETLVEALEGKINV